MSALRLAAVKALALALVALLCAAPATSHAQTYLRTAVKIEDIGNVLQNYYRAPLPGDQIAGVVQLALVNGLAETRPKRLALIAFMAGLIAEDPATLDPLASVFAKLPGDQPHRLIRAVLYSGRPDWQDQIARLKTLWPDKVAEIERLAATGGRAVYTLKRDGQPEVLDMNWAFFGATGRREPVMALIEALGDLRATDPDALMLAHAARLSLATQAMQHDRVYDIILRAQWGSYGDHLRSIIVAANSKDVTRFKADADAAIQAATEGKPVPVPADLQASTARTSRKR